MALKDWKILRKKKDLIWFQNKKKESQIIEVSTGTIQTGDKFEPYEKGWRLYIPNRMAGTFFKTKRKAISGAKKYMKEN